MAIQNRRGIFSDLDPTKLLPGEYAVVISGDPDNTDGNGVYICFAPGQVKKLALTEDTSLDGKIYPELTAGDIISNLYSENKTPYFFRPSGGGAEVGTLEAPVLVGGSVGWNQLVQNGNFVDTSNWNYGSNTFTVSNNKATLRPTARYGNVAQGINNCINNHVYLGIVTAQSYTASNTFLYVRRNTSGATGDVVSVTLGTSKTRIGAITKFTNNGILQFLIQDNNISGWGDITIENAMVIDLTLLLGSTIADRLYTLEQSTAGSGIAQLKAWGFDFGEYIPYSAPTLRHVEGVSEHRMVGFNQWDEEWEVGNIDPSTGAKITSTTTICSKNLISILPSTNYYINWSTYYGRVFFYDASQNYINYLTDFASGVITTPANACYMYFRMASTYGTNYNHDICINISDTAKNGTYEPYRTWSYALDSTLTLRGVPKLDANNQLYYDGDTYEPDGTVTRNCAVRAYQSGDESLADAITDGTNTVYKLSTPTTEQATPYTEYQEVDANGTEEYVSTGVVPVGHTTKYPTDLKGAVESILSAIPSANGTYALKVTVANGKHTFSWV